MISFEQVVGCHIDVTHSGLEEQYYSDGKTVSYNPPRYKNYYNFFLELQLKHPELSSMRFKINRRDIVVPGAIPNPELNAEYSKCKQLCEEMKNYVLARHQQIRNQKLAAAAPKQAVNCPHCGATTIPDPSGRCEYCGSALS